MTVPIEELPVKWRQHIKNLRAENAHYRWRAKDLRDELEALRAAVSK